MSIEFWSPDSAPWMYSPAPDGSGRVCLTFGENNRCGDSWEPPCYGADACIYFFTCDGVLARYLLPQRSLLLRMRVLLHKFACIANAVAAAAGESRISTQRFRFFVFLLDEALSEYPCEERFYAVEAAAQRLVKNLHNTPRLRASMATYVRQLFQDLREHMAKLKFTPVYRWMFTNICCVDYAALPTGTGVTRLSAMAACCKDVAIPVEHAEVAMHFFHAQRMLEAKDPCFSALKAALEVQAALQKANVWSQYEGAISSDPEDNSVWIDWWNMNVHCHAAHGSDITIDVAPTSESYDSVNAAAAALIRILMTRCRACGAKPGDEGKDFRQCSKCHLIAYCSEKCETVHYSRIHAYDCVWQRQQ